MKGYTQKKIQQAREYAAQIEYRLSNECLLPNFGYADHVTEQDKQKYSEKYFRYAQEIEQGIHDNNFTIWQRMNYYLTGESVAFLS